MLRLGYDNPKHNLADDRLERRRLALDIAELIRTTPVDISARIGVFGGWGTGKSTVLEMLATLLEERGYVIVRFNPATSESFPDLVSAFADNLVTAFMSLGLYAEPRWRTWLRHLRASLSSKNTFAIVDGLGELHKGAKLANAGLGILASWLSPSGEQIRKLREALPESRVVVLIDDLDRCPPKLLPKLLLSLREILDIERFTFVLAFDDDIVASGLKSQNSAWETGHSFLEKILDFRFTLPETDKAGRVRLLLSEIKERAGFIPLDSVTDVEDLLPGNPRRIKALVRSIIGLEPIIKRHNDGEFSWTDVWLVELLRQECHMAAEKLANPDVFEDILGMRYRLWTYAAQRGDVTTRANVEEAFLQSLNLVDDASQEKIVALLAALRARGSEGVGYVLSFANRAPSITWKEFFECLELWKSNGTPATIGSWLEKHAERREDSLNRVAGDFAQALSNYINGLVEEASRKTAAGEMEKAYDEIIPILGCARDFFALARFATADRLSIFYGRAQYWVGVNRPGAEANLRNNEREMLAYAASCLPLDEKIKFLESLKPWTRQLDVFVGEARIALSTRLHDAVVNPLLPEAYESLLDFLKRPNALKKLREKDTYECFKGLLFAPKFIPWPENLKGVFSDLLQQKIAEISNYDFAMALLDLFKDGLGYHTDISHDGVAALIKDHDLVKELWAAVQRVDLLERGELFLLAYRAKFIGEGADEEDMPIGNISPARVAYFEQHRLDYMRGM